MSPACAIWHELRRDVPCASLPNPLPIQRERADALTACFRGPAVAEQLRALGAAGDDLPRVDADCRSLAPRDLAQALISRGGV